MGFVMVLSYSRLLFLRFYLNAQMNNFLRGLVDAFSHFNGVARTLLYDTLVDRLVHRTELVTLEGDSYRLKEAKERAEQKAKKRSAQRRKRNQLDAVTTTRSQTSCRLHRLPALLDPR